MQAKDIRRRDGLVRQLEEQRQQALADKARFKHALVEAMKSIEHLKASNQQQQQQQLQQQAHSPNSDSIDNNNATADQTVILTQKLEAATRTIRQLQSDASSSREHFVDARDAEASEQSAKVGFYAHITLAEKRNAAAACWMGCS